MNAWLAFRPALAGCLLTALLGCGPTGGGTGTGESIVSAADFGARAASSCSAPFAALLMCASVSTVPVDSALLPGTGATEFNAASASGPFRLTLQGNRAELQSRCHSTRFEGEWGVLPTGEGRYFGSWTGPDRDAAQPAWLGLQAGVGAAAALQLLVQDDAGRTLLGPLQLQAAALTGPAAACP